MENLLACFLLTFLTASVLVGVAGWFLLRFLKRRVDRVFLEREKVFESKLRRAEEHDAQMLVLSRQVLTEIDEVIYRSMNLVREIVQSQDSRYVESLIGYWNQLSDHLFKYQLFVPSKTFDLIHQYKMVLQSLALRLGTAMEYSHEEGPDSSFVSPSTVSEEDLRALRAQIPKLDKLYAEISANLSKMKDHGLSTSLMTD